MNSQTKPKPRLIIPDWFIAGLGVAVALAWALPGPGASGGWLHPEVLTKIGVAVIFFLHGLRLSFASLKSGALNWRLHAVVQVTTFLFFPILGVALLAALNGRVDDSLRLGLFYLCALPSTVSSAIVMTATARGNVAGAVFNATISNLAGVVLTPLWIAAVIGTSANTPSMTPVVLDLVRWLVAPLAAGQVARRWLASWAFAHRTALGIADRGTILLLVYASFCDSFAHHIWSAHSTGQLVAVAGLCVGLFSLAMLTTGAMARAAGCKRADRIAAMFCGSKKTLAAGVPMARLIFAGNPALGLILLPIMIYHPLQLVICGVLAQRWGRESEDNG